MKNKTIDVKDLSIEQLKAFAYDEIGKIQTAENILGRLNSEIASRQTKQETVEVVEDNVEEEQEEVA